LAEQHFRPLGARQTQSRLLPTPLEARGQTPAKTLPRNAVQSEERRSIYRRSWNRRVKTEIPDKISVRSLSVKGASGPGKAAGSEGRDALRVFRCERYGFRLRLC
jgi:hypothetical protein